MDVNKNVLSVAAIIIAISVGYYFVIYLPQNNKDMVLANQVAKCTEMGAKTYQDEQKQNTADSVYLNPEYKYDSKLNACLYKSGFIASNYKSEYIIDLYTNKEITSYTLLGDQSKWNALDHQSFLDFQTKSTELFGH